MNDTAPHPHPTRRHVLRLGLLFGGLYFIQGIVEPQNGLMYQPTVSLLTSAGHSTSDRGDFFFWLGLPWSFKPIYGLLSDFVPLAGFRRRSWLFVTAVATAVAYGVVSAFPGIRQSYGGLLGWLIVANLAVAFTDVVVDATMVEAGQPLGITGRLQSIQWGCMQAAMALAGLAGGYVSEYRRQDLGYLICGVVACGTVALTIWGVDERRNAIPAQDLGSVLRSFGRAFRSRTILLGGAFLLLLNFNPFSAEVLNEYQTAELGFSEQFVGRLLSLSSWAQMGASFLYGLYCTRVPFRVLVHGSIVLGILSTLGFWGLDSPRSAVIITLATGAVSMTAVMIQLDLAARVCPPQIAGTMFALLMALSNTGTTLSSMVGGRSYDALKARYGAHAAFQMLVAVGAAFTAACWLVVPWMLKQSRDATEE